MAEKGRGEGGQSFIDVESGTRPVHVPCPKRAAAIFRSPDRSTEIIVYDILNFKI